MAQTSNSGHPLPLPHTDRCPMFGSDQRQMANLESADELEQKSLLMRECGPPLSPSQPLLLTDVPLARPLEQAAQTPGCLQTKR